MTERELFFRHLGLPSFRPMGLEIQRAEGTFLYDASGKKYFDLVSGICVSNVGHRHPKVMEAVKAQMEKYSYLNVYGEFIQTPQVELARKLTRFLPAGLSSVYLVNSGSEAVEGALKLAKRFTGRTEIISYANAYHGSTHGALSVLGNEELKNAFRPLLPGVRSCRFNNFDDILQITNRTACVIIESIQAEAGMILAEEGFLTQIREQCDKTGALLILDDVQMGFGRTGKLFSFEHFGFVPDILVLAKAMGGGMPLGAFISSKEIMDTIAFNPELGHITTFGGHPVSCAAAIASLDVLTSDDLIQQASTKGQVFRDSIRQHPSVKEIRSKGLALGVELTDPSAKVKLTEAMLNNGVIIDWFLFNPGTFRIAPPLTITEDEIEQVIRLVIKSLNEI